MNVLAITAHPDEEILFAGTLRLLVVDGHRASLLCATRGERGAITDTALATRETLAEVRTRELETASTLIGISDLKVLDYPDGRVPDYVESLKLDLQSWINAQTPGLILTFGLDGVTRNADNVIVGELVSEILDERGLSNVTVWQIGLPKELQGKLLYYFVDSYAHAAVPQGAYEPRAPSGEESQAMRTHINQVLTAAPSPEFSFSIDVQDLLNFKAEIMRCHKSQPGMDLPDIDQEAFAEIYRRELFRQVGPEAIPNSLSGRVQSWSG